MKEIAKKVEADGARAVGLLGALKRAIFSDCHACGDTGITESGAYCTCRQGALKIEADVIVEQGPAPQIHTHEPKRLK